MILVVIGKKKVVVLVLKLMVVSETEMESPTAVASNAAVSLTRQTEGGLAGARVQAQGRSVPAVVNLQTTCVWASMHRTNKESNKQTRHGNQACQNTQVEREN